MQVLNAIDPTPEQIKNFLSHKKAGEPVFMLNLLKFKDRATYKDGEDISGEEAYFRYATGLGEIIKDANQPGVKTVFGGDLNAFLIGSGEGDGLEAPAWDCVALVEYPDAQTMISIVSSDAYRQVHKHRRAGLAGQLLISCSARPIF